MSRPRSRSPINSYRNTAMYRRSPGRRDERAFSDQYVPGPPRRVPEMHGPPHWNDARMSREGPPNEWGRFNKEFMPHGDRRPPSPEEYKPRRSPPEYLNRQRSPLRPPPLGYAERRRLSPKVFDEMQGHSPRRLPKERQPSPALAFDHHHRRPSPDWARNEHGVGHHERQEGGPGRGQRGPRGASPRGRSFNRSPERRPDRLEHGNYPVENNEHYHARSPFSDRLQPKRSDFRDHRPDKRSRDMGHYEEHSGPQKPYSRSPGRAPVIVEHDHGISQHGAMNRGGEGDRREHVQHAGPPQDRHRREPRHDARESSRMEPPPKRRRSPPSPPHHPHPPPNVRARQKQSLEDHDLPHQFQERHTGAPALDVDLRPDRVDHGNYSGPAKWEQQRPDVKQQRGNTGQEIAPPRPLFQHRNLNVNRETPTVPRVDTSERETLKIKVDMNRPTGQDSSSGHNSDRQLSLDLVNVGRQRLDFLPMLEHSGTFRETQVHTGTFAQEIITLVHQVKEMYFKGENVTLNDRFSSVMTATPEEDEEPAMDRRIKVSVPDTMPIFSKIENMQAQKRPQTCDPSDLRYDLERRRQERLEGVKVTITGASFSQATPESVETEPVFEEDERLGVEEDDRWAEEAPEGRREWGGQMPDMRQRLPGPNRRNFKRRFNRPGAEPGPNRRQYHNNANGANW
ncbi:BCLAF1 and THRAP3 family member 3 isoform X2 [Alosa sapidissima]|uniref:BCLAF1 and THRAP3 family member 3 isoform X2 n=1 Tax=Alosa sapidissima TaxID=34773 RepID=UPI001C0872E3|nr:BCLAF1 and THRAP3 family member 3 isoform X2 [Alosa sapidissima]